MEDLTTAYRNAAMERYASGCGAGIADGDVDFDADATVSDSEHGAYVAAWVWIDRSEVVKYPASETS